MINRSEVSQALAKAIAYKNCGKDKEATAWAVRLLALLECSDILQPRFLTCENQLTSKLAAS